MLSGNLRAIKASYGHNRLLLESDRDAAPLAQQFGITLRERRADGCEFAVPNKESADRFLASLTQNGIFPTRYELREPSLNEIFIEKAGMSATTSEAQK